MLNEVQEFKDYTQIPTYTSKRTSDTAYLGRFTVEAIRDTLGFERIFTILARGYLFRGGDPYENAEQARKALCAWCSIPDTTARKDWECRTCFPELHTEFPELVDADGIGWYIRHIHAIVAFAQVHPKLVKSNVKTYLVEKLKDFETSWRNKVRHYQIPIYQDATDGIWDIRFDDIVANALELGPLREMEAALMEEQIVKLRPYAQDKIRLEHLTTLVAYYQANKPKDSDWVALPASSFNNYFGSTVFSKQVLPKITGTIIQRSDMSHGSGRYKILDEYL